MQPVTSGTKGRSSHGCSSRPSVFRVLASSAASGGKRSRLAAARQFACCRIWSTTAPALWRASSGELARFRRAELSALRIDGALAPPQSGFPNRRTPTPASEYPKIRSALSGSPRPARNLPGCCTSRSRAQDHGSPRTTAGKYDGSSSERFALPSARQGNRHAPHPRIQE